MARDRRHRALLYLTITIIVVSAGLGYLRFRDARPYRIGVLLHLTGPIDMGLDKTLDWGVAMVNDAGGIGGRPVELVYRDLAVGDLRTLAGEMLADDDIKVVIGPVTSDESFDLAPLFVRHRKLLITPTATSADLGRAFGRKKYFWRTCVGDVAQIKTMLHILKLRGVERIGLLYEDTGYGKTFLDWTPFFALEMGVNFTGMSSFERGQDSYATEIATATAGDPEYLLIVALPGVAATIAADLAATGSDVRPFFADAAQAPHLVETLGDAANGLEGTAPAMDPTAGFAEAYLEKFGEEPNTYGAATYDAFLMSVYALARHQHKRGWEWPEDSLRTVLAGRGRHVGWDQVTEGISLIVDGGRPDIAGASGPLTFDRLHGVEPLGAFYARWEVTDGAFHTAATLSSGDVLGGSNKASMALAGTSMETASVFDGTTAGPSVGARGDLWTVIIATSKDWKNYRHQADALAMYRLLRSNGVPDDRIILFLIDDIPYLSENPLQGVVRHIPLGPNVRKDVTVDYVGEQVTVENLRAVLLGEKSEATPVVVESDESSNVFLFIVDHGMPGAIPFDHGGPLSATEIAEITDTMHKRGRFRKMFIMVEVCFGESVGLRIDTPGVLYFTGAALNEQSFGANYDGEVKAWLADDFTHNVIMTVSRNQNIYISDLYTTVYSKVVGSHVRMRNAENFGDVAGTKMTEFVVP